MGLLNRLKAALGIAEPAAPETPAPVTVATVESYERRTDRRLADIQLNLDPNSPEAEIRHLRRIGTLKAALRQEAEAGSLTEERRASLQAEINRRLEELATIRRS